MGVPHSCWCLLVLVSLALKWSHKVAMAQKNVFECFDLYKEQHDKLASIKDEHEKHDFECVTQRVQLDCLIRVSANTDKDLEECQEKRQRCSDPKNCVELRKRCSYRDKCLQRRNWCEVWKECTRRQKYCTFGEKYCDEKEPCVDHRACEELRPCPDLKPCVELKVKDARNAYMAECGSACQRSSWAIVVLLSLLLKPLLGMVSGSS